MQGAADQRVLSWMAAHGGYVAGQDGGREERNAMARTVGQAAGRGIVSICLTCRSIPAESASARRATSCKVLVPEVLRLSEL